MAKAVDYRTLSGPQKAAAFMLAVGREHSTKIFERMDDEEIRELSHAMSTLGSLNAGVVERLFVEFADQLSTAGGLVGSYDSTERLLMSSLPEDRVKQIMEEMRGPAGRTMWDKLGNVNEAVLANYLKNEYPQTVAVVLSKIKTDHAARVLALLPENFSMEVIMRMLRMEAVQKEILDHVERTLRTEFMTNLARTARRDSHELMADIFNNLDRNTENRFMTALEERNRESAERIKQLMFTFDDLVRVDSGGIQLLLRQVEKDQLAVALKGSSQEVKELFFANMSERAGKMMKEDMDAMGAVRLKDVDEAQSGIVQVAKALSDAGEIVIAGSDEESELIY
ncbi:MAG: flagellar motor switch protein FliG [Rhodospirillales bacterium]